MSNDEILKMIEEASGDSVVRVWELKDSYVFEVDTGETEFDALMYKLGKGNAIPIALDLSSPELTAISNGAAIKIK